MLIQDFQDWLRSGMIMEIPDSSGTSRFWIGYGRRLAITLEEFEVGGGLWSPDFYLSAGEPSSIRFECSEELSRSELTDRILKVFPEFSDSICRATLPIEKVAWAPPERQGFTEGFARLKQEFAQGRAKKAVPVVFATGTVGHSNRPSWLARRLLAGLNATAGTRLRLYGDWTEQGGFIGATPESLFSLEGDRLRSMAVAGTRAVPVDSSDLATELLRDPKEREEHELVASDIQNVLENLGLKQIARAETRVIQFRSLMHLVTDFTAKTSATGSAEKLVQALHPTPALGVSPRTVGLELLREIDRLTAPQIERQGFGAPFVAKYGDRTEALVAIRQLRWSSLGDDRLRLFVGSGCGVVPASQIDREWSELAAKRRAIAACFALSEETPRPLGWSRDVLGELIQAGVRDFIVCAGARNAPLVVALEHLRTNHPSIRVESFFDERSASFFALGRARRERAPVAVVTTSGTAATELTSAMAEADFSGVPLIAVTADRPMRLRGSGAPQSIDQAGLFQKFVEREWDLECGDPVGVAAFSAEWSRLRPLHLNLCFDEPLLSDPESLAAVSHLAVEIAKQSTPSVPGAQDVTTAARTVATWIAKAAKEPSAIIVGRLEPDEIESVREFIFAMGLPCLLEGPSGLRGDFRLSKLELKSGEEVLQSLIKSGEVKQVLRLGGVPTTRVWRDLDDPSIATETTSFSRLRFSGLGRGQAFRFSLSALASTLPLVKQAVSARGPTLAAIEASWLAHDQKEAVPLELQWRSNPKSEPAIFNTLSKAIPESALVYIGNSLPIREWDQAASRDCVFHVEANRGVNGIDGQISTALGLSSPSRETWIIVGDLTALYDLTALWPVAQGYLANHILRIVVINNSGGQIFSKVLAAAPGGAKAFVNNHGLNFSGWASLWGVEYRKLAGHDLEPAVFGSRLSELGPIAVVEIQPQESASAT